MLMYRVCNGTLEVLLVHPGGPFWRNRDDGAWTIPKGGIQEGEDALSAARREFEEETGFKPQEPFVPLEPIQQKGGKIVHAWAFRGDCDPSKMKSNNFTMEYPPKSGQMREFPEIDRAAFFAMDEARKKMNPAQVRFLEELQRKVHA
jgi:predicted NUDIX family NTP pyrophosphohydrolase